MSVDTGPDLNKLHAIVTASDALEKARTALDTAVSDAKREGYSWTAIGAMLDVTRQAAWERFHDVVDESDD